MKKVSSMGLALFLCLGMAACNGGNNAGSENQSGNNNNTPVNGQKEDAGSDSPTVVNNITNVTEITQLGQASLAGLKMVKDDSGKTQLVATFDGDVQDLDARLAGTSVTLEYMGDEYVPLVEKENHYESMELMNRLEAIGYIANDQFSTYYSPYYYDTIVNVPYYAQYAPLGFLGGNRLYDNTFILHDIQHDRYFGRIIVGGSPMISIMPDYSDFIPGRLDRGMIFSFQLGSNFSCSSSLSMEEAAFRPVISDRTDSCLADVKEAIQGWLDMSLGAGKIAVALVEITSLDAYQMTSVILEVKNNIDLDSAAVLTKADLAGGDSSYSQYLSEMLDGVTDFEPKVLRLELPANMMTDINGRPNGPATLLLIDNYSSYKFENHISGRDDGIGVEEIIYKFNDYDNLWQHGSEIYVNFDSPILNKEMAQRALQKYFDEIGLRINASFCLDPYCEVDLILTPNTNIMLPLEVTIPAGLLIDPLLSKNEEIVLKLNNVVAPEVVKTAAGSTVWLELAQSDVDRKGTFIQGDRFVIYFSENISDYMGVCTKFAEMFENNPFNLQESALSVSCESSSVSVSINEIIDYQLDQDIYFGTLKADEVKSLTDVPMAADIALVLKKADIFAPKEVGIDAYDKLVAGFRANFGMLNFKDATGASLDDTEVRELLSKATLENAKLVGADKAGDVLDVEYSDVVLKLGKGQHIEITDKTPDEGGYLKFSFVLPEGAFDEYGISTKGQKLSVYIESYIYMAPAKEITLKATYSDLDSSNGALVGDSLINFMIDGDIAQSIENEGFLFNYLGNELSEALNDALIGKSNSKAAITGGEENADNSIYVNICGEGMFPNGTLFLALLVDYTNQNGGALVLEEPLEITIPYGSTILKWQLPATTVSESLAIRESNPADGLLTTGDVIEFRSSCMSVERYNSFLDDLAESLNEVILIGENNNNMSFRYVGDKAIDVSQGLKIGDLELKEEKIVPTTFKYVAGSANGNQAVYEAAQIKGGNYLLQSVENMTLSADDYSVFVPGGTAVGVSDIFYDAYFWDYWFYEIDIKNYLFL